MSGGAKSTYYFTLFFFFAMYSIMYEPLYARSGSSGSVAHATQALSHNGFFVGPCHEFQSAADGFETVIVYWTSCSTTLLICEDAKMSKGMQGYKRNFEESIKARRLHQTIRV